MAPSTSPAVMPQRPEGRSRYSRVAVYRPSARMTLIASGQPLQSWGKYGYRYVKLSSSDAAAAIRASRQSATPRPKTTSAANGGKLVPRSNAPSALSIHGTACSQAANSAAVPGGYQPGQAYPSR